jgi:hypothetical protein
MMLRARGHPFSFSMYVCMHVGGGDPKLVGEKGKSSLALVCVTMATGLALQ